MLSCFTKISHTFNLFVHLVSVNGQITRSFDDEADLIAAYLGHGNFDGTPVTLRGSDENGLVDTAGENKQNVSTVISAFNERI